MGVLRRICGVSLALVMLAVLSGPPQARPWLGGAGWFTPAVANAQSPAQWKRGTPVALKGTPHLWVADDAGVLHWAGDTRALQGRFVDWSARVDVELSSIKSSRLGDPWLSAGLVKVGDTIYLAKWESNTPRPVLLHIQSLAEVELFGINGSNYGTYVQDQAPWEARYGFAIAGLTKGVLEAAVVRCKDSDIDIKMDYSFNSDGTLQATSNVENKCARAVHVILDISVHTARGGPMLMDAPTIFITNLGPGEKRRNSTRAPIRSTPALQFSFAWDHVTDADAADYCVAVGATRCLRVNFWLRSAVDKLMQTARGTSLVRTAADGGIRITQQRTDIGIAGFFRPSSRMIAIDDRLSAYSSWIRAITLAHELQHASDFVAGSLGSTSAACYRSEEDAFKTEAAIWLEFWSQKLPPDVTSMHEGENAIALAITKNPAGFATALQKVYHDQCN